MFLSLCRRMDEDRQLAPDAAAPCSGRRGTTMMEYLMMVSLIVVFCLVAIGYLGSENNGNMSSSADRINKATGKKVP
jgi:hypothetical protein